VQAWLRHHADDAAGGEKTWPLERVAWRAGELRMEESAPLLGELLEGGEHPDAEYALAWALARTASARDLDVLRWLAGRPGYAGRMGREGLRRVLSDEDRAAFLEREAKRIPFSLRDTIERGRREGFIEELASGRHSRMLSRVYLLEGAMVQEGLRAHIGQVAWDSRVLGAMHEVFQASVVRSDGRMFGVVALRLEQAEVAPVGQRRWIRRRTRRALRRAQEVAPEEWSALSRGVLEAKEEIFGRSKAGQGLVAWIEERGARRV